MTQELTHDPTHDPKLTTVRKFRGALSWHTVIHTSALVKRSQILEAMNWRFHSFWPVPQLTHGDTSVTIKESYGLNQWKHTLFPPPSSISLFLNLLASVWSLPIVSKSCNFFFTGWTISNTYSPTTAHLIEVISHVNDAIVIQIGHNFQEVFHQLSMKVDNC